MDFESFARWTGIETLWGRFKRWRQKRSAPLNATKQKRRTMALVPSRSTDSMIEVPLVGQLPPSGQDLLQFFSEAENIPPLNMTTTTKESRSYRLIKTIGTGSFSKVKLAQDLASGELVAIKLIDGSVLRDSVRLQQTLGREIQLLQTLPPHPNLVQYREAFLHRDWLCLVMEWVEGGELFDWVSRRGRLAESEALPILRQLLEALEHLHRHAVVHRDVKLENVLIDPRYTPPLVKLCDFGLARLIDPQAPLLTTRCGSEEYAAPEVLRAEPYDGRLSDCWSFGVVLYACLVGSLPFNPDPSRPKALAERIITGRYHIPDNLSPGALEVLRGLLQIDPRQRWTLSRVASHPWFKKKRM